MNKCMHIKIILPLIFIVAVIFTGCDKIDLGKPIECSIGTSYKINNGLSFTIDSLRDYRCPADWECLWGGDVDMYFNFDHHSMNLVALVNLNSGERNPFSINGYTWKIQEVNPLYRSDEVRKREDYRIKMIVTKN
jgi:hypothetical protein